MTRINLRDLYPFYYADCFLEVEDVIAASIKSFDLREEAYRIRTHRHKAYFSLDRDDGIEHDILFASLSPCEIYERKLTRRELYAAIASLPDKQAKRIYAYYFLGMSKYLIARAEGVNESSIRESIERGLRRMESFLKRG